MEIYLVGGAVRDQLLGQAVHERDWVVVGSTAKAMIEKGFQPVGKDFPVFLHPETKEEYALARTEKKVAAGYAGFTFYADPSVTLEEDLKRRDLTINAMAQDKNGQLIDPYGGEKDLKHRVFRHVSDAFAEDPVRVLRLARFAARFTDFNTSPETVRLMKSMAEDGEIDALVPERVWKECEKALKSKDPSRFFSVLEEASALTRLFGNLINERALTALSKATEISSLDCMRWAACCASQSLNDYQTLSKRYRIPKYYNQLCESVIAFSATYLDLISKPNAEIMLTMLTKIGAMRDKQTLLYFQQSVQANTKQALKNWNQSVSELRDALQSIDHNDLQNAGLTGAAFGDALKKKRLACIMAWQENSK